MLNLRNAGFENSLGKLKEKLSFRTSLKVEN